MLQITKMRRETQLVLKIIRMEQIRNGRFSMLIKLQKLKQKDSMKNSASTSTDHSTSSLNFHSTELLSASVPHIFVLRDGETMSPSNNSSSMRSQRPSDPKHGPTMPWIFRATEAQAPSELHQVSPQGGGKCSESETNSTSLMRKERSCLFKVALMLKTEQSS